METIEPHNSGHSGAKPEIIEMIVIEIVELEEHAKHHGTHAPHAKHYAFRVDKERIVVDVANIDGKEILAKVGKTPEKFKLYQHKRGHQPILIPPDYVVDLREPGVERFTTMPKDTTEGREALCLRQDFRLADAGKAWPLVTAFFRILWDAVQDAVFSVFNRSEFRSVRVEEMPDRLKPRHLYLVGQKEPWSAALLCPCGCKAVIQLSLLRTDSPKWSFTLNRSGVPTLSPSVWRTTGCRSHFFLRKGSVVWCNSSVGRDH